MAGKSDYYKIIGRDSEITSMIKKVLDEKLSQSYSQGYNLEERMEQEKLKEIRKLLKDTRDFFNDMNKYDEKKDGKRLISGLGKRYYNGTIGITNTVYANEKTTLKYELLEKEEKEKKSLNLDIIHKNLNKVANLIQNENKERKYIIFYHNQLNGDSDMHFVKRFSEDEFDKEAVRKNKDGIVGKRLAGTLEQELVDIIKGEGTIEKDNSGNEKWTDIQSFSAAFSDHLNNYLALIQTTKEYSAGIPNGVTGYLDETFLEHAYEEDSLAFNEETGYIEKFSAHGPFLNDTDDKKGETIRKAMHNIKYGKKRWLVTGDVNNEQLKSVRDFQNEAGNKTRSSFSITSNLQLMESFNLLYSIFYDEKEEVKSTLSKEDLKNLLLFMNEFHIDVASSICDDLSKLSEKLVEDILSNSTTLGIQLG